MSCERADTLHQGYFDNELDPRDTAEFEYHLERCYRCIETLESLKSLRSSMNLAQLYEGSSASPRKKVLDGLPTVRDRTPWRWLAIAAAALVLLAYTGWQVVSMHRGGNYETVVTLEIVDAHLRSLQPGHLTDVVSSDQHTVKPWFEGRLDFSPVVRDFGDQGFLLQGGRLDVVHGRTIAAFVYRQGRHLVNIFIWPTTEQDALPRAGSHQGYQWINWRKGRMEFCAISDAAPSDLERFQRLFTE
jgi:anti-sigma factor RsiW